MSEYSRTNFVTTIATLYDDALASKATTRANHRTANGHVKDSAAWLEDFNPVTAAGTDTYTASMLATLTSYANGRFYLVLFTNANTGAATLNINSLGAKSITKNGTAALAAGDIQAGSVKILGYDGTRFQLVGTVASAAANITVGTSTITSGTSTRIPFNDAGVYSEDSALVWDKTNNMLSVGTGASNTIRIHSQGGIRNTFVGPGSAGALVLTGNSNSGFGYSVGSSLSSGLYNCFFGSAAGHVVSTGNANIGIGVDTLFSATIESNNIAIGYQSLQLATSSNNIAIGYQSGDSLTTGFQNILIGHGVEAPSNTANYQLTIGNLIFGTSVDGSGTTVATGSIGIGTNSPDRRFHVELNDATDTVTYVQRLTHTTSIAPAIGIGVGIEFEVETTAGNEIGATIEAVATDIGSATEDFDLVFKTMVAGFAGTEHLRFGSNKIGFFGATSVVKQAGLTAITHTAPGTPDYAIQDLTAGGFGFVTKDEGNTVLSVIKAMHDAMKNYGLLT